MILRITALRPVNLFGQCKVLQMKSKIFIVQRDNDKYFKQKLPTWRNGFCEIVRNVTIEKDPHDIYQDGEWGYITVYGRKIYVTRAGTEFAFEIRG